jgi:hypothetical protein
MARGRPRLGNDSVHVCGAVASRSGPPERAKACRQLDSDDRGVIVSRNVGDRRAFALELGDWA